jgi:lambda repressor-like predicted transcriptional regulator
VTGGCHHGRESGSFDESARRVSWPELEVGRLLAAEGHHVRAIPDARGRGKVADFDVCGVAMEVKTLSPGATSSTLANALRRGREQGEIVIVDASASGLARHWADRGVREFAAERRLGKITGVRVIGAGFELSYSRADLIRAVHSRHPERDRGTPGRALGA